MQKNIRMLPFYSCFLLIIAWEQRKLGEVVSLCSGKDYKHLNIGEIPVYGTGGYMLSVNDALSYNEDAIGIGRKGTIDKPYILRAPFWTVDTLFYSIPKNEVDLDFIYTIFQRVNWKKKDESTGVPSLSKVIINSTNITVPIYQEQIKVGTFFKQLDDIIALNNRKYDALKQLKSGYLAQIFSQNLRFSGFLEDWEVRKFKDFIVKSGLRNKYDEDFPAYSVSNQLGLIPQIEQFEASRLDTLDKTAYKFVQPHEFAYNPSRINVGSIAFNNLEKTVIVSSLYVVLKTSDKLNNEFVLQYIKSPEFLKEVKRNTEGSVREYLFYESFKNIKLPYTSKVAEQMKIGIFLKYLDQLINQQQTKVNVLKEIKQSYLQKIFV
ncbi:restriction endonuclease subunit S [Lactococcus piscium]|uniref:restriction endonuclease subunit S n=1 Tax=Pseudolactococcus carnosus TaxID=2749961 RepID=UPI001FBB79A7|nr:restriction endonuclease subunit S [Lactococcus carnosus]MCJ1995676.1 restriction endonuclease subunit S [Lactococcus carnosus]